MNTEELLMTKVVMLENEVLLLRTKITEIEQLLVQALSIASVTTIDTQTLPRTLDEL